MVYGILEDDEENLWLSTSRGISRLNPSTGQVKTYDTTHGLQGNDFMFGRAVPKPGRPDVLRRLERLQRVQAGGNT